jgi:hypothetical protein
MRGDFSRFSREPERHRRNVLWQRGRVLVDADWNEAVDLTLERLESLTADLLGVAGGPAPGALDVAVVAGVPTLTAGRFYVEGVLAEVPADVALTAQADLPGLTLPSTFGRYLAYLEVWEEGLGTLESPELAEPALGGEESARRSRVVAQVRLLGVASDATPALYRPGWSPRTAPPLALEARSVGTPGENQLYRVEVHQGGELGAATWKWSRDNASVAARVLSLAGTSVTLSLPAGSSVAQLLPLGGWVELTSRARLLRGEPGALGRVLTTTGGASPVVTVEGWLGAVPPDADRLVRWDSAGALALVQPTANEGFLALEEGLEVRFSGAAGARVETGDAWLLPLRAVAGVLGGEAPRPPDFGRRRAAPLRLLSRSGAGWSVVAGGDCRRLFAPAGAIDLSNKVDRSGDTRTGSLTLDSHLFVTGTTRVGAAVGAGGRLAVGGGARLAADARLRFGDLGAATASLGFDAGPLRLAVAGGSLRLAQNGADRLVLTGGRIGVGTVAPQVDVEIDGALRARELRVSNELVIVDGNQGTGRVLTALDGTGRAQWQGVASPQVIRPIFFQSPVIVNQSGSASEIVVADYTFPPNTLPPGATAVILEGRAAAPSPDEGAIDHYLRIRLNGSQPWLVLLRGRCAGDGDDAAWATQGVFPLNATGPHFQYSVRAFGGGQELPPTGAAFPTGWRIRAVGYFL